MEWVFLSPFCMVYFCLHNSCNGSILTLKRSSVMPFPLLFVSLPAVASPRPLPIETDLPSVTHIELITQPNVSAIGVIK